MNFDLDLKHTQWLPICKIDPKTSCEYKKKFEEEEYAKNYCQEKVCNFKCGCSLISYDKFKR